MPHYRTNADGSAVCPHRDLSVCADCAADPAMVEVAGAHFHIPDAAERAEFAAIMDATHLEADDDEPGAGWPGHDVDAGFDGFDDWAAANGELATTFVDGEEVVR